MDLANPRTVMEALVIIGVCKQIQIGDSKAEVTNNIHFLKEVPRHQILETVDCHFHNQRDKRLKRKRKKNKYEAVKKFRLQKETEAFLEEEEIKDLKKKLREQEREKSELIGEARMLSKLFTNIAINNPNYTDKEFHRCRTALYNASNATHRT